MLASSVLIVSHCSWKHFTKLGTDPSLGKKKKKIDSSPVPQVSFFFFFNACHKMDCLWWPVNQSTFSWQLFLAACWPAETHCIQAFLRYWEANDTTAKPSSTLRNMKSLTPIIDNLRCSFSNEYRKCLSPIVLNLQYHVGKKLFCKGMF